VLITPVFDREPLFSVHYLVNICFENIDENSKAYSFLVINIICLYTILMMIGK